MWQFLMEYWAQWVCTLIGAGILAALPKIKALWGAVLALLHDRIYTECYRFMELGYITQDGLRNLGYLYKTYHMRGGNGTGTELYNRAKALPIHTVYRRISKWTKKYRPRPSSGPSASLWLWSTSCSALAGTV